ncbi:MAG: prepilin-type N-terminal cleavage/methylation domain-containing protein [Candidatus Staskawiczbacteria bacterium]|nr:prepilin-type N-terminal cleavage/methylation domain-containing protein [Candidatus Staskawiczbacteria bacterium]
MFHISDSKFYDKGITLIEIVVAIFIITFFSLILIADYPKIKTQYAISRATYKLAQDLRRAQDFGLSGAQIKYNGGIVPAKGYGIYVYVDPTQGVISTKYLLYADVSDGNAAHDKKYTDAGAHNCAGGQPYNCCDQDTTVPTADCVIDVIDLSQQNSNLYIKSVSNISTAYTSVNFIPPNPTISIDNISSGNTIGIVLGLTSDSASSRTVFVNTSGLINVQ